MPATPNFILLTTNSVSFINSPKRLMNTDDCASLFLPFCVVIRDKIMGEFSISRCSNTSSDARSWSTRWWRRLHAATTVRSPLSRCRHLPLCRLPAQSPGWTNGSVIWTLRCDGLRKRKGSKYRYLFYLTCRYLLLLRTRIEKDRGSIDQIHNLPMNSHNKY